MILSTYHQSTATIQDPMTSSVQQQPQDSPAQYTSDVAPQSTKHDSTPEKPIMNDSGVDFISPTILQTSSSSSSIVTPSSSVYTPPVTSNEEESENDQSIEEEEDENKENEESSKQGKSKSGKKTSSSDSNLPSKPPKPYLEIIANAVLSSPVKMMQLHEIYAYMESKYSYFLMNVNKSWRNSVRHNLSLNECFIKAARGTNGKGNYWRIHPLCEREFIRGNFRRKTFKQLIRAGGQQRQQHQQQQMSLPYPASFGSLPLNYSVGMFPPPPPTISANMFAGENKQLQNNSVHYRPY